MLDSILLLGVAITRNFVFSQSSQIIDIQGIVRNVFTENNEYENPEMLI